MARSVHVAPNTRKQSRAVPYAHHISTSRSLGQSMRRQDVHTNLSPFKQTPDLRHVSSFAVDSQNHSSSVPFLQPGVTPATCDYGNRGGPDQSTSSAVNHRASTLAYRTDGYPISLNSAFALGPAYQSHSLAVNWSSCNNVDSDSGGDGLDCLNWALDPAQTYIHHLPQYTPVHEQAQSQWGLLFHGDKGAPTYLPEQTDPFSVGPLSSGSHLLAPHSHTQDDGFVSTWSMEDMTVGGMNGRWDFMPPEHEIGLRYVDHDTVPMHQFGPLPSLESCGESEDGLLVESPSLLDDRIVSQSCCAANPIVFQAPKSRKHTRSKLAPERRVQAATTRKWGACIRCSIQKVRCEPNPKDPQGGCCLTCGRVSRDSKKVIHRLPCLRWKLTEVIMFRADGLNLTRRWTGTSMRDLSPSDWVDQKTRVLTWQLEHSPFPMHFTVKKFQPQEGDSLIRKWKDSMGRNRVTPIEPFGLADIQKTAAEYLIYNHTYALPALAQVSRNMNGSVNDLVSRTYGEVAKLIVKAEKSTRQHRRKVEPADFLSSYVKLWFGIRNSVGSAFITQGTDMLDMQPENDPDYPFGTRVSISRMISEQFHNLQHEKLLTPLRKRVLEDLTRMMFGKEPDHFFIVYLTVFMMLYETSFASADRHRRAVQCDEPSNRELTRIQTYYSLPLFVEKLQYGANIVLLHWHYYKRGFNPLKIDWDSVKDKAIWATLTIEQREFLRESWQYFADRASQPMEKMTWRDDMYFVAQMFEDDLSFGATYSGS